MADTRLCCRVKCKRKSEDMDPYFNEETTMARSASTSAMLSGSEQVTQVEHAVLDDLTETDDGLGEKLEQKTADCAATASSSRGESHRGEMSWAHLPTSIDDDDDWVDVPMSFVDLDSDWQPRCRSHRVYDRFLQGCRSVEMWESDHTQTDTDSESSGSGRMIPIPDNHENDDFDVVSQLGLGPWHDWFNLEQNPDDLRETTHGPPEEHLYPQGELTETECYVCFEDASLHRRLCCNFPVCDPCLESYLTVQVSQANVNIECLNINCNSYIHRNEISARLPAKMKMKFYKFLIDANIDPTVKTCPRCSSGLQVDKATLKKRKVLKNGLLVTCQRCGLEWCFTCHSPWHKGLTCKQFRKGDVLLKDWAREFHYGQLNAQKCPKCKIFIQRSLGCDHMTCSRCDTSFCYRCGENYRGFKLLGNHFSRLSPFGCRYNFMPDAPHLRRFIRGAVLGGKLIGGLALSGFVVAAGAFLLGVSVVALPAWGGYKLHKRRKYRQRLRAHCKYAKQNLALRNLQAKKAAETSVPVLPVPALDSSDSAAEYDDSSDENRDHIILGLQLPDSHRVEVLVHRTVGSSSEHEETGGTGEGKEVMTESSVILTDLQEVVGEDGYTTVVANVYAKSRAEDAPLGAALEGDGNGSLDDSDEEYGLQTGHENAENSATGKIKGHSMSEKGNLASASENQSQSEGKSKCAAVADSVHNDKCRTVLSNALSKAPGRDSDAERYSFSKSHETKEKKLKDADLHQEKKTHERGNVAGKEKLSEPAWDNEKKEKEAVTCTERKEKQHESGEKNEKRVRDKDKQSLASHRPADQRDTGQLMKENSNGCFGNIFSKKITVIQISGRRNTVPQSEAPKPGNVCNVTSKSATWEKSNDNSSNHKSKTKMDIRDISHFNEKLPCQTSDTPVGFGPKTGVLLQDFVVISPPGDFSSQDWDGGDSSSVSLSLSADEGGGFREEEEAEERESSCCLSASDSFRGSNLSCDIVTYL